MSIPLALAGGAAAALALSGKSNPREQVAAAGVSGADARRKFAADAESETGDSSIGGQIESGIDAIGSKVVERFGVDPQAVRDFNAKLEKSLGPLANVILPHVGIRNAANYFFGDEEDTTNGRGERVNVSEPGRVPAQAGAATQSDISRNVEQNNAMSNPTIRAEYDAYIARSFIPAHPTFTGWYWNVYKLAAYAA